LEIKVIDLGIGTGVGVDVHMHKVECELMGGSRGDKVRIWTDVPLQPREIQSKYINQVEIIHNTCLAKGNPKRML
jgi:hypothetical protein